MNLAENPIVQGIGRIADFVILNLLWLICSIPIFTIGASTAALYTVMLKLVKNEDGYITRDFLKAFKENFKKATALWLIFLVLGGILVVDFSSLKLISERIGGLLRIPLLIMTCLLTAVCVYAFALQARFENTVKNTFKNAVMLSLAKLPYTALILFISITPVIITFMTTRTLAIGMLYWLFIGFAMAAWLHSIILRHIFKELEPQTQPEENIIEE